MLPVIIAPVIGVWGIQYFLNKKWLWGIGCIAITLICYFLSLIVKACWPERHLFWNCSSQLGPAIWKQKGFVLL